MNRNSYLLFPGLLITMLGSSLFSFATGLYLLDTTGKGTPFAINLVLWSLPSALLSPFIGVLVDRLPKKNIILIGDLLNGVLMLGIFLLWNRFEDNVYLIYLGTALSSFFSFIVFMAYDAGKPELFSKDWLVRANAITTTISSSSNLLGPILGGFIYSFVDIHYFIMINGISFLLSFVCESFLNFTPVPIIHRSKIKIMKGFEYIRSSPSLLPAVLIGVLLNIGFGIFILLPVPYIVNNIFHFSNEKFGIIQSFFSLGFIVSSLYISKKNKEVRLDLLHRVFYIYFFTGVLFLIPLFLKVSTFGNLIFYILGMFIFGGVIPYIDINIITFIQTRTPNEIIGQVMGSFIGIVKFIFPVSLFVGGILVDYISPIFSIALGMSIYLVSGLIFTSYWKKRKARELSIQKILKDT